MAGRMWENSLVFGESAAACATRAGLDPLPPRLLRLGEPVFRLLDSFPMTGFDGGVACTVPLWLHESQAPGSGGLTPIER